MNNNTGLFQLGVFIEKNSLIIFWLWCCNMIGENMVTWLKIYLDIEVN